jgi:hypothetical protein
LFFVEQVQAGHQHARCTESTLERVMLGKGLLQRMQGAVLGGEPLYRRDAAALGLYREHQA